MGRMLRVRLTEDEWAELKRLADAAGVDNLSDYVRALIFETGSGTGTPRKSARKNRKEST
jgi:hypothetical protein